MLNLDNYNWNSDKQKKELEEELKKCLPNPADVNKKWIRWTTTSDCRVGTLEVGVRALVRETTEKNGSKKIRGNLLSEVVMLPKYYKNGVGIPNTTQYYWVDDEGNLHPIKEYTLGYCIITRVYNNRKCCYERYLKFFKEEEVDQVISTLSENRIR